MRFTGESDRRGPATAAEGLTRRAVNTCPASEMKPPRVFRVQPEGAPGQGHEARNASDGFLGALGWFRAEAMAGVEVAGRKQFCATETSIQAF